MAIEADKNIGKTGQKYAFSAGSQLSKNINISNMKIEH